MGKSALVVVFLGLVLGALVLWLRYDPARGSAVATGALPPEKPEERPTDRSPVTASKPVPARRIERSTETLDPQPRPKPIPLSGTIVVVDEFGVEHREESGVLAFELGADGSRTHHEVEVRGGRWSAPSVRGDGETAPALRVGGCTLRNRVAALEGGPESVFAVPADGRVALRMRWLTDLVLHVRARDTGRELEGVVLCELPLTERSSIQEMELLRPGPLTEASGREVGPSPVHLDTAKNDCSSLRVFYAKSADYAWGRIEIDTAKGEEHTLFLEPAGELELLISCEPWNPWAQIELVAAASPPVREFLDEELGSTKAFVLGGLPPGHYIVQARDYGRLLGAVEVEVVAGDRAQATLAIGQPSLSSVPFDGILVLPAAWDIEDFHLDFWLRGNLSQGSFQIRSSEMVREEGSRDRLHWSASGVQAARYGVILNGIPFSVELDTGSSGVRDALVEVPPPGLVSLRCLDERSAAEVESESIEFGVLMAGNWAVSSVSMGNGKVNPTDFRVPQGEVLILTRSNLYEPAARIVTVGPGWNEVILRLRPKM